MTIAVRRDSFCGKMSACNNMMQYGIPYSLTTLHTEAPESPEFRGGPGVVRGGLPHREGLPQSAHRRHRRAARRRSTRCAIARSFSKRNGISVETLDLSEFFGRINRMKDNDDAAQAKLAAIKKYVDYQRHARDALLKMAKLGAVIDGWMATDRSDHQRRAVLDLDGRISSASCPARS